MSFEETAERVIKWGESKGIFDKSSPAKQLEKTQEEVTELSEALTDDDLDNIRLEAGDVFVTLILLLEMKGLHPNECLEAAYSKISKRTGKMIDGLFVKDGK